MKNGKYFVFLVAILFLPVEMTAQKRIDINQAYVVSENFYRSIGISVEQLAYIEEDYLNDTLCLYCVHYSDGKWAIVSASERAFPVLAYGKDSNMTLLYSENAEFNAHIWRYKRSILDADIATPRDSLHRDSIVAKDISERWQKLLYNAKGINTIEIDYTPSVELLKIPGRGKIEWGQDMNNDNGCYPSYNKYCQVGVINCSCIRTPTGCAPVAMGQIMWYWQWPLYSPEDGAPYVWEEMPEVLHNGTDTSKANKVAKLLYDLGQNMYAIYSCALGTGVLQGNAYNGFESFGYEAIDIRDRSDWSYGYAWTELVRTEIDNNRPVVIYGEDGSIVHGHYFVVDGYLWFDNNYFHINWGHAGSGYGGNNGSEYYLLYATNYSDNMSAYVGISPSYNTSKIIQYYHDNYSVTTYLSAIGNLTLPDATLSTIGAGQNVIINAGQSVTLSPGFEASAGSEVSIEIDENFHTSFDIVILGFPDFDNILSDGANMKVANANSFECSIYKVGNSDPIFQHSGCIRDNLATLWDGTDYDPEQEYKFDVTFRNNFGKKYHIIFYNTQGETTPAPENGTNEDVHFTADRYTYVMPNPASGNVTVASSFRIGDVELLDLNGKSHLRTTVDGLSAALDISSLPAGTYIVRITTSAGTAYKKLVVK